MATYTVKPPSGFDWVVPITVYFDDATNTYSTSFNNEDWKVAASQDRYVSTTGNDTTGDGSSGNPWRTISHAFTQLEADSDVPYNLYVEAGEYRWGGHFSNTSCDRDVNIIATGGRAVCSNAFTVSSWSDAGSGVYTGTRASVLEVLDYDFPVTQPDGVQIPQRLTKVADLAACQATAGTWYQDGTTVGVHLNDGRSPDAGVGGQVKVSISSPQMQMSDSRRYYIEGFDFETGVTSGFEVTPASTVTIPQVCIYDCRMWYQQNAAYRAFDLNGVYYAAIVNCKSYASEGDAFGYSRVDGSSPSTYAIEIGCKAYGAGLAATHTSIQNGSTNHAAGRTVRVNCQYYETYGPVVADIGTTQSWNINVHAEDCLVGDGGAQDSLFSQYAGTGTMWCVDCSVGGSGYNQLHADTGCTINWFGGNPSLSSLATGGAGTVQEFTRVLQMNVNESWRGAVEPAESGATGNEIQLWRGAVEPAVTASTSDALIGGVTRSVTRGLTRGVTEGWSWGT